MILIWITCEGICFWNKMAYRRDTQRDETISLPIETVYNSCDDAITCIISPLECILAWDHLHIRPIIYA